MECDQKKIMLQKTTPLPRVQATLRPYDATLVAVSKTKPKADILALYEEGQRDFGENRAQELAEKAEHLPKDIRWHMVGHLQRNKVKYIAPFIHLLQSVDSPRLLRAVNKEAAKVDRVIDCLLQFKIAREDTKYGFDLPGARQLLEGADFADLRHVRICGVMGMATFTDDKAVVRGEFQRLRHIFDELKRDYFSDAPAFRELSMGMSNDYEIALEEGSTMVRIGTLLFGERNK